MSQPTYASIHVTHRLGCGCLRWSNGKYSRTETKCAYPHEDKTAEDSKWGKLVDYACGCVGYCRCGADEALRVGQRPTSL